MTDNLDPERRYPVEVVFPDLPISGPPVGSDETVEFGFVVFKIEDDQGELWSYRTTSPPNRQELLGALEVKIAAIRRLLAG